MKSVISKKASCAVLEIKAQEWLGGTLGCNIKCGISAKMALAAVGCMTRVVMSSSQRGGSLLEFNVNINTPV